MRHAAGAIIFWPGLLGKSSLQLKMDVVGSLQGLKRELCVNRSEESLNGLFLPQQYCSRHFLAFWYFIILNHLFPCYSYSYILITLSSVNLLEDFKSVIWIRANQYTQGSFHSVRVSSGSESCSALLPKPFMPSSLFYLNLKYIIQQRTWQSPLPPPPHTQSFQTQRAESRWIL